VKTVAYGIRRDDPSSACSTEYFTVVRGFIEAQLSFLVSSSSPEEPGIVVIARHASGAVDTK
jgi:hypothetical protein